MSAATVTYQRSTGERSSSVAIRSASRARAAAAEPTSGSAWSISRAARATVSHEPTWPIASGAAASPAPATSAGSSSWWSGGYPALGSLAVLTSRIPDLSSLRNERPDRLTFA
jgi:hypothetical protein